MWVAARAVEQQQLGTQPGDEPPRLGLGMKAPSLYEHFPRKDALEAMLISIGFEERAALFQAALENLPSRWWRWVGRTARVRPAEPTALPSDVRPPLNRSLLVAGSEEAAAAPSLEAAGGWMPPAAWPAQCPAPRRGEPSSVGRLF